MKLLGIDSSGLVASVAVVDEKKVIAEFTVNNGQTHSQTLLPMIDQAVQMSGVALKEMDAIAVAAGPGSFTGLRIGSSTAKGLGLALHKPIVPVPALSGLAYRMAGVEGLVCPLMDARRNQVYTAAYHVSSLDLEEVIPQDAVDIHEMIAGLNQRGEAVTYLGDGVEVYGHILRQETAVPFQFAPVHMNKQSAASVAALGLIYYRRGRMETAADYKPFYLRKSQAEREREEKLAGQQI